MLVRSSLVGALLAALAPSPQAQVTTEWLPCSGGSFGSAASWDQGVPGAADVGVFDLGCASVVNVGGEAPGTLFFRSGSVVLQNGSLATLAGAPGGIRSLWVETVPGTSASLELRNMTLDTTGVATIGYLVSAPGTVVVGSGAVWRANVDGNGWVAAGGDGFGTLEVRDGGQLLTSKAVVVGDFWSGDGGHIEVTGSSSIISANDLIVGLRSPGSCTISGGATVSSSARVYVGDLAPPPGELPNGGSLLVSGQGSPLEAGTGGQCCFVVGRFVDGTVEVELGGQILAHEHMSVGRQAGSTGTVLVRDPGSRIDFGAGLLAGGDGLSVGGSGSGVLSVSDGGVCSSDVGAVVVGEFSGGTGAVDVDGLGSELRCLELFVGGSPLASGGDGILSVRNEGVVTALAHATVWPTGEILLDSGDLDATCFNEGVVRGEGKSRDLVNDGRVEPGGPVGRLTVRGDFVQRSAGVLELDVNGFVPGVDHDVLEVVGHARLSGTLRLVPGPGFQPQCGQRFRVARWGSVSGEFTSIDVTGSGLAARAFYGPTGLEVEFGPESTTANRLGMPANPDVLHVVSGTPAIGTGWSLAIDHSTFLPSAHVDRFLLSPNPINHVVLGGTLLCDRQGSKVFLSPAGVPLVMSLPNDCSLLGLSWCVQGASKDSPGGPLKLTNAIDFTIGID